MKRMRNLSHRKPRCLESRRSRDRWTGAFFAVVGCWFLAIVPLYLHCSSSSSSSSTANAVSLHIAPRVAAHTAHIGPVLKKKKRTLKRLAQRPLGDLIGNDAFIWKCEDANAFCADWAHKGECERNPAFMNPNCRKSCKHCDEPLRRFELAPVLFAVGARFSAAAKARRPRERTWLARHDAMRSLHRGIDAFVGGICKPGSPYVKKVGLCVPSAAERAQGHTTPQNPIVLGHTADGGRHAQRDSYFDLTYQRTAGRGAAATLCEVGFNAGHSAAALISASDAVPAGGAQYFGFGFDAMRKQEGGGINGVLYDRLNASLSERAMTLTWGRSQDTVPPFFQELPQRARCNVVSIDGSHAFQDVLDDLRHFKDAVEPGNHIIVADDTRCKSWFCEPPTRAWIAAVDEGLIRELACWEDIQKSAPKNWRDAPLMNSYYRGWCAAEYIFPDDGVPNVLDETQAYARLVKGMRLEDRL